MKSIICYLAMAMALTACSSDDETVNEAQRSDRHPLLFTATVEDLQTRVTNDMWDDGDIIGVRISNDPTSTKGKYVLNADGTVKETLTGVNWQGTGTADITAWYPFEKIENMEIADQSAGLKGMNLLKAELKDQTYEEGKTLQLAFKHQMARVRCRLKAADGSGMTDAELAENAKVEFVGQTYLKFENGKVTGNNTASSFIIPYKTTENGVTTYTALLVPHTDKSGSELIRITVGNNVFHYRPENDINLEAGKSHNYIINVKRANYEEYYLPDLADETALEVKEGYTVVLNGGETMPTDAQKLTVKVNRDANVILKNVNIKSGTINKTAIACNGTTTITLMGENKLEGNGNNGAALSIENSGTLTIREGEAGARLTAIGVSGGNKAGINSQYGNIVIESGTITATGGSYGAAGIGSGYNGAYGGNITIKGGTVTATGGGAGAGIGSGSYNAKCGTITISGGTVTATGGKDGGAGIGSGSGSSSCGDITISGSGTHVTATKGNSSAKSIGAGENSTCGTVSIAAECKNNVIQK